MKKRVGLVFCIVMIFALFGCIEKWMPLETKTLSEFYEGNLEEVNKVVIADGTTGGKKTLNDSKQIKDFLDKIKDIKFIPEENQEDVKGWRYSVALYVDDEETFKFLPSQVNGNYYYTEPEMIPIIDDLYNSLVMQEE
ncbi:hypothetical protein [Fredinandcohnia quinoae]|uniref:Lipoprotein n=1 Tax=Fredinandcohnia quinoae TaxID=2918902 RepID=A0AAW5E9M9_9BACI|nr:hypothetical protein [Fredinandcohnia sp. SECRCQ15]MCH1626712.1 hypothetical protein [Fredinandcohnia sp. SECRCQ15]